MNLKMHIGTAGATRIEWDKFQLISVLGFFPPKSLFKTQNIAKFYLQWEISHRSVFQNFLILKERIHQHKWEEEISKTKTSACLTTGLD